jgi:hypothetical protein
MPVASTEDVDALQLGNAPVHVCDETGRVIEDGDAREGDLDV